MAPLINLTILTIFTILINQATVVISVTQSEALLVFKSSLISNHTAFSTWKPSTRPCTGNKTNWGGILCEEGRVWGIKLEGMGISGAIDVDSLVGMPHLRMMSLINNSLDGKLPKLNKVGKLKALFLSHNKFSGPIDQDCFDGMTSLKKLYLSYNAFTGQIPMSLATLPRLVELSLEGNQFSGVIPNFTVVNFKLLNFSDNKFDGPIPYSVTYLPVESFSGNAGLCGHPLQACTSSKPTINVIFVIFSFLAVLAVIGMIIITLKNKPTGLADVEAPLVGSSSEISKTGDMMTSDRASPANYGARHKKAEPTKLVFLIEDRERFELPDLLNSSAETLGNGSLGVYYKACLPSGKPMVVKRFKQMNNVGKEEFQEHMWRIARLNHPNLLSPVAFYYRKEEKLLVSDYINNVSLATYLHHSKGSGNKQTLNWSARLKIIKGVAKGLLYLHNELPSLIVPHGHLKSSNVLLTESLEPLMTDYALIPVFNTEHAQELMVAYKSPEHKYNNRITKKTDAWSLGVLILEILTGKFPTTSPRQAGSGSDIDWVTWVQSTAHEDTAEVFDKEMKASRQDEAEMMKMLRIGLSCAEMDVDKRYDIKEALRKIEELKGDAK
ncbi:pollen receptor-like kinase 4 [Impatiens glandulifera]|uniref:pollen receptor-like kinase 4 n=1 Tax=Impatiens glandulifera TaxID=253017 RepID=UPI001FB057C4|nr:pollen receptor-like kinase 4 [Impatiens glandulifera]